MKPSQLGLILVVILGLGLLGYAFFYTSGNQSEVDARITQIMTTRESKTIKTNIIDNEQLKRVETYTLFGSRPIPVTTSAQRANPFEGI